MRNNNNEGQGLKHQPKLCPRQKAGTQATGHRGKRAGLEEGRNKKEKAEHFNMGKALWFYLLLFHSFSKGFSSLHLHLTFYNVLVLFILIR
jgi:hypothetical protein